MRRLPVQSRVFFFLILGLMLYLSWLVFHGFVIYIITGTFVAVLALPIDKLWEKVFPNRVAAGFTMLTLLLIITIPILALGIAMYNDVTHLAGAVNGRQATAFVDDAVSKPVMQNILHFVFPGQNATALNATVHDQLHSAQIWLQDQAKAIGQSLLGSVPEFLLGTTVILLVVYYILVDGENLVAWLRRVAPLPSRQVDFILREARLGLQAVFMGQIVTALLQGVLGGIGFVIVGLPNAVLWGAAMAILSLFPIVGGFIIWGPAGLYLFLKGNVVGAIILWSWGALIMTVIAENILRPKLIGDRADVHPMLVLVGVLGGAIVFGFIGLFLGPLLVGVTLALLKVYEADYLDPNVNLVDEVVTTQLAAGAESADPDTAPAPKKGEA